MIATQFPSRTIHNLQAILIVNGNARPWVWDNWATQPVWPIIAKTSALGVWMSGLNTLCSRFMSWTKTLIPNWEMKPLGLIWGSPLIRIYHWVLRITRSNLSITSTKYYWYFQKDRRPTLSQELLDTFQTMEKEEKKELSNKEVKSS